LVHKTTTRKVPFADHGGCFAVVLGSVLANDDLGDLIKEVAKLFVDKLSNFDDFGIV
jgi:hypothetical protein